jgi:MFS family permease
VAAPARDTPTTSARATHRSPFEIRDFRLFWTGALVSNVGTWMQNAAVPYVMYSLTESSAWVGLSAFAMLFPGVVLGPVAGAMADRLDRRRLLSWSQASQAVVAFALAAVWAAGVRSPSAILAIVAVGGVLFGLGMPAWQGFVSDLVPRPVLPGAVQWNSMQFHGSRAIGPALAGLVLATLGPTWAFVANGLSYAAVLVAIALVSARPGRPAPSGQRVLRQLKDGFSYARHHEGIAVSLVLVAAVGFLGNPVVQLAPVFAERIYGVGAGAYGVLTAAFGFGAASGIYIMGRLTRTHPRSRIVLAGLFVLAGALAAFGLAPVYGVGLAAVLLAGSCAVGVGTLLLTSVQLQVSDAMRGRVLGVYAMVFTASYPIGALAQGWLADRIGPRANELVVALALLAVATVVATRRPWLRGLDGAALAP